MKGKKGRPRVPFSNISSRKPDGLTGSPSDTPSGEGNAQMARGGAPKKRADKKARGGKIKNRRADGGAAPSSASKDDDKVPPNIGDSEPDMGPSEDDKPISKKK